MNVIETAAKARIREHGASRGWGRLLLTVAIVGAVVVAKGKI